MRRRTRKENGATLVEFALAAIPLIFTIVCIMQLSLAMWTYHTLAFAVREGARFAATKGQGCSYSGNTCSVTVAAIAQRVARSGFGLAPTQLKVTLSSQTSTAVTCNPLNTCYSNTTKWPPASDNAPGSLISLTGYYPSQTAMTFLFMPSSAALRMGSVIFAASSQQQIEF